MPNLFLVKFSLALKMCPVPAANCTLLWAVNRTSSSLPPPLPLAHLPQWAWRRARACSNLIDKT